MTLPYREFYYPLNALMHILTLEGESPVDALHYGLFDAANEPIAVAQARSTELLIARLPTPPARLLEVGIGLGTLLHQLTSMGYHAEGITPDAQQLALVRERYGHRVEVKRTRFEAFDPLGARFDLVLFQESSQYIESSALFAKASTLTSRVLILDEFALQPVTAPPSLRSLSGFLAAAAATGFSVVEELDLSARAAPTIEYFLPRIPQYRESLVADLGVSGQHVQDLITSGQRYLELYRAGAYGYRLLDLEKSG